MQALVLTVLALGIGANTLVFSVVDGVLLRPLPYPDADRLVAPWQTHPNWLESDNPALRARWDRLELSYPVYEDWEDRTQNFEALGIYAARTYVTPAAEGAVRTEGAKVSHGFLRALGVAPFLGRPILEEDDRPGGPRLVLLGHGFWQERFGGDRGVVGRTMILDEEPHTIVGVMPRGFSFPEGARLWTTLPDEDRELGRNQQFARAVARLQDGVSLEAAQRDMEGYQKQLNEIHPIEGRNYGVNLVGLEEELVGNTRPALLLLLGAVVIFLAVACVNVTNLLLLRASQRTREMAVRRSVGADGRRLLGQLLAEGLVVSLLGCGLGILLARLLLEPFLGLLPAETPRLAEVSLNGRVIAFSVMVATIAGVLASVGPGLAASRTDPGAVLRASGRGTHGGRRESRTRSVLLVSEIALTFVLLVGSGLLARSFSRLTDKDPGFASEGLVVMRMDMRGHRYATREQRQQAYDALQPRLEVLPGVASVAFASPGPFRGWWSNGTTVDTRQGLQQTNTEQEQVSANYFETIGVPVLAGRTFTPDETARSAPVVLVNEAMVDAFWPESGGLGERVKLGGPEGGNPWLTVIGVVGSVRRRLDGEPYATLYHPLEYRAAAAAVVMRTTGNEVGVLAGARAALREVDADIPVISLETLDRQISRTVAGPRLRAVVLGTFAVSSAFLAILGVFGLLSFAVTQRTREIGLRMAMGAEAPTVMGEVLRRGATLLGLGLAIGLPVSILGARTLQPFLFEVESTDPTIFLRVALLLSVATLAASAIPARRAMQVDPMAALRRE